MKTYIGTKTVKAEPCTLGDFIKLTGRNPYENDTKAHSNLEEGYLIEYSDEYKSWSPKDVFKEAYKCSETFLDRLHIEMSELYSKMDALVSFIDSGKIDEVVTEKYQNMLLRLQQRIMSRYINVLECRIGRLDDSPEAELHLMTFGDALEVLKQGGAIRRRGWNGKGLFVVKQVPTRIQGDVISKMSSLPQSAKELIMKGKGFIDYTNQCLIYNENTGRADSWVPSISDVFADDWEIYL